jgi:hypothetical protein
MYNISVLTFIILICSSCTNNISNFKTRSVASSEHLSSEYYKELEQSSASKGHKLEFPSGLNQSEQLLSWHITEGSDIYPTLWLLNLKSFLSIQKNSLFFENLDQKFGVIKSPYYNNQFSPYGWVGLTAVLDGEDYERQDLIRENKFNMLTLPKVTKLKNGKPTIVMTGANCAFCHTGSIINDDDKKSVVIIDGAPATVDMKAFFYDIIGSTYQTMFNKKELTAFYERLQVKDAQNKAHQLVDDLKEEMDAEDTILTKAISLMIKVPVVGEKINDAVSIKAARVLYEKKDIMTKYLKRMLKETYDLEEITPLMEKRMEYLTWFGAPNPDVITTPEGFGRTDAFGRISNATIRKKAYTHLTAPVSLPPMYGMKYKAFYHYNGNTNSLVSRNIGQAFGLGAIFLENIQGDSKKIRTTVNLPNLIELEKLIYKVPVPNYAEIFPQKQINKELALKGCDIYLNKCATCHEGNEKRVGAKSELIDHKIIDIDVINTDRNYIKNISKEALGVPFKNAIFSFTDAVKDGFYFDNQTSLETQREYASEASRGKEIFRDTYLGENRFDQDPILSYTSIKKNKAYVARHLAGVWSTAPYLHNGSIPNLYELLLPDSKRTKQFIVGNLSYDHQLLGFVSEIEKHPRNKRTDCLKKEDYNDPHCFNTSLSGNGNFGHHPSMYGGELKNSEKFALIEFLKILAPELETSWKQPTLYKIENNKCSLRSTRSM